MKKFEPYIRSSCIIGLSALCPSGKTPLKELMPLVGLDPADLNKPDVINPYNAHCNLMELCAKEWDRPFLGLEFTLSCDESFPNLGGLMLLAKFNKNLQSWVNDALEYWAMHTNGFNLELKRDFEPGKSTIIVTGKGFLIPPRQTIQHGIANICRVVRVLTNRPDEHPIEIHFTHARQKGEGFEELAQRLFGCPIHFESEQNQIIFPTKYLDYKIDGGFALFKRFLRKLIQYRIDALDQYESSISFMVSNAIPNFFGSKFCNFLVVSELLDIKPKTLQRMLAAEGTNFKEILSYVRMEKAKEMLTTSDISVSLLARFLAYSETAPFSYAFRKATGCTPLEYRKRYSSEV